MPLDVQVEEMLRQIVASGQRSVEELTVEQARRQMEDSSQLLGAGEEVAAVEDLVAPGPAGEIPVRLYRPRCEPNLPAVVYFHGGGWVVGSIDTHDAYCRMLANASGAVVASVDYRLAPEHKFPAAAEDAYAATCWVCHQAAKLGLDPQRIGVAGDSAGGNLAAVTTLMARDRRGPHLAIQLLIYPIVDHHFDTLSYLQNAVGFSLTRDAMIWFWKQYLSRQEDSGHPYASPLRVSNLRGLPPALVLTAEYDPLRDEGEAYARKLSEAGVAVTCTRYEGMIHGFVRRTKLFDQAQQALVQVAAELRRVLVP